MDLAADYAGYQLEWVVREELVWAGWLAWVQLQAERVQVQEQKLER